MPENEMVTMTEVEVRFNEVDMMQIVWHGHYVQYMEEGREHFGKKYGISYMDIRAQGYMAPVVSMKCEFKKPLEYGDRALVETRLKYSDAAKLIYIFNIYRASDKAVVATGESVQVFMDMDRQLVLTIPPFFAEWKKKWDFRP
jgi:acyl-CoA thioester hydrolase